MFSFFRKKSPFTVVVKEFDHSRFAAGMEVTTDKHDYRKDVTALQQTFQAIAAKGTVQSQRDTGCHQPAG